MDGMYLLISGSYNAFYNGYNSAGIYMASGLIPSESYDHPIYIGSSVDIKKRITRSHIPNLNNNDHDNKPMQNYINKYGIENLVWYCVEPYTLNELTKDELLSREQWWLNTLQPFARIKRGFNICERAGSRAGHIVSEETKVKMSQSQMGRKHTSETLKKMSDSAKQRTMTPLRLQKILEAGQKRMKTYTIVSPQGETIIFTGLRSFCRDNNLSDGNICCLFKGTKQSVKGWTLPIQQ